jgi:hypothetical protein
VPFDIPGADETTEQVQVLRLAGMRARRVEHGGKVIEPACHLAG